MFTKLLAPRSADEDSERKEHILNVLLLSSIGLFGFGVVVSTAVSVFSDERAENFVSIAIFAVIMALFGGLYLLSRKGFSRVSAYILIGVFFGFSFYMGYHWGVSLTSSLILYALVIVMAGILVNTRFAFVMTFIVAVTLVTVGDLQAMNFIVADYEWKKGVWGLGDSVMTSIMFLIIATVSWLSNREIERSLARAHRSEKSLRKERDMLEIIVEERTKELKEAQLQKISQLYSFAEFGRLSSGLFHDLMNPLTAVSLNVERAKSEGETINGGLSKAQEYLDEAFVAAKRMERFIGAVRKQIGKGGEKERFSLSEETADVIDILSYKAQISRVRIEFASNAPCIVENDPVRWSQIMLNLISNAVDAYDEMQVPDKKIVITLDEKEDSISCTVSDWGVGIPPENCEKIFEPFFTTKPEQLTKGTGIGLCIVKRMVEKDFNGTISVSSAPDTGTIFSITLPK